MSAIKEEVSYRKADKASIQEQDNKSRVKIEIKRSYSDIKLNSIKKIIISILLGFLFGLAMEKAKVYEPIIIKQQMVFERFIMLKMFLSALATSTLSIILLNTYFTSNYNVIFGQYRDMLASKSMFTIVVGGCLIGLGIQIAGSCPGMVLVQLGAGVPWASLTFFGALVGALVHGLMNEKILSLAGPSPILSKALFEIFGVSAKTLRTIFVFLLVTIVVAMEYYFPWKYEYPNAISKNTSSVLLYKAWPPSVCGILLGSLQFFSISLLGKSLGNSSCYTTIVGVPLVTKDLQDKYPYLTKFRSGLSHWLTVLFMVGAIFGGFISSYTSGAYSSSAPINPFQAFFGGFIMIFGARMASGCTSGHGISGCSYQFLGSFIATASMFASAIALGLLSSFIF